MKFSRIASAIALSLGFSFPLLAANRAFVSGTGIDTSTCPITAPCRSFAYALTQITGGGEIIALDTAGYGSMTIGMAVSIIAAPGVTAFATATSGNVVTVAAGTNDIVTLRGLTVTGNGLTGGIIFGSGLALNLENCFINGHSTGIEFARSADSTKPSLQVLRCIIANNLIGIDSSNAGPLPTFQHGHVRPMASVAPPPLVYIMVKDSAFLSNSSGVYARDDSNYTISDTAISGSSGNGLLAVGSDSHPSAVSLFRCTISRNATGIYAGDLTGSQLTHGIVELAFCQITGNDTGVTVLTPTGVVVSQISNSVVTNAIINNGINGSVSSTYSAQ